MMPFWIGLGLASVLAYPIFRLLIKLNSRQKVSEFAPESHQAKQGTPTMGGLIFVIPFLILGGWFSTNYWSESGNEFDADAAGSCWYLFALFAIIGFVDDYVVPRVWPAKRGLGWKQKLLLQFVAASLYPFLIHHAGIQAVFELIAIVACANAYNFADGLDGLATSIVLLLIPGLIVANYFARRFEFIPVLLVLGGSILPFAYLNAPKAKVFMGDIGSLPVGAVVGAALFIPHQTWPTGNGLGFGVGITILALVLVFELIPVPLQILWVKVFGKRLFSFTPIHHAFEKAGWPETRVMAAFATAQLVCTLASVTLIVDSMPWNPIPRGPHGL